MARDFISGKSPEGATRNKNILKGMGSVFDHILDALAFLAGILVIMMMLGISSDVIGRYFLNKPAPGIIQFTEYFITWIAFLAAAWLLKLEGHVNMDLVINRLNPRARNTLNFIISIVCAIASSSLVWYGIQVVSADLQRGTLESGIRIPTGLVLVVIPVGSLALVIQFLRRAYKFYRNLMFQSSVR